MKRIILMVFRNLLILPYWLIRIFQLCNIEKYDSHTRYAFLYKVVPIVIRRGRIKIHETGQENLPSESGYVMFPNHQGLFDALAIIQTHERPLVTVMKKEVKNTFLLKQVITMLQAEVIDRDDIRQSMQVIMNMTRRVKTGENFVIFAEGTRSRQGNSLLEFKGGSFKSAMNAKCPVVPVALIDSYKAFDTGSIRKLTVHIHYLKPLYYEEYKGMKSTELAEKVSNIIRDKINFETSSIE
jgi:1-acyl-sn-glycerol-3-phosphate acyltransferase